MTTAERDHRRDAADAEAAGDVRLLLGVQLGDPDFRGEPLRCLFVRRRHHPARPAPWRPEIDDNRQIVRRDVAVEVLRAELDRVPRKQQLLACAAARCRGPGLPGAVRVVPVASAGAAQIPCEHPYGIHDPAAVLRLPAS